MSVSPSYDVGWLGPTTDLRSDPAIKAVTGRPYWYGKGGLLDPWPLPDGTDCSGLILRLNLHFGLMTPFYGKRRIRDIANDYVKLPTGAQRAGDIALYGDGIASHGMFVLAPPDTSGHSACIGANGGNSATLGNDPSAFVRVVSGSYWPAAFMCYARLRDSRDRQIASFLSPSLRASAGDRTVDTSMVPPAILVGGAAPLKLIADLLYPGGL